MTRADIPADLNSDDKNGLVRPFLISPKGSRYRASTTKRSTIVWSRSVIS